MHVCSFSALDGMKRDMKRDYKFLKAHVLKVGRFSIWDATENDQMARIFTRLCKDPELDILTDTDGFSYPWTGVRLKKDNQR